MLFGKTISYCVLLYAYNNTHEFVGFLRIVESRAPSSTRVSGTRIRGILYEDISNNVVLGLLALNVRFTHTIHCRINTMHAFFLVVLI